jgi:hypothetical protein
MLVKLKHINYRQGSYPKFDIKEFWKTNDEWDKIYIRNNLTIKELEEACV